MPWIAPSSLNTERVLNTEYKMAPIPEDNVSEDDDHKMDRELTEEFIEELLFESNVRI